MIKKIARKLRGSRIPVPLFRLLNGSKAVYRCPICDYSGPFRDSRGRWISKKDSRCPSCDSTERTRIEWAAIQEVFTERDPASINVIHFAPEKLIAARVRPIVASYQTADLEGVGVDHQADLCDLPFPAQSFDLVIASHVLEHIKDDAKALSEIRRILKPGGIAVLPVPTTQVPTVEYPAARPEEAGHVRAPGRDYFDRYVPHFDRVVVRSSDDFPSEMQLLSRPIGTSDLNLAYVPICYA